jgi:hypothetical protein
MKNYYSVAQLAEILTTFTPAPCFDKCKFREQLERVAWFHAEAKAEADERTTPSKRQDSVKTIGNAARRLRAKLREADESTQILGAFRKADSECPVYRRLQGLQQDLAWLGEVTDKAAEAIAADIGKGGNRPDVHLHELIRSVWDLYEQSAATPRKPTGWGTANESSGFLAFLQAILRPLGVERSHSALRQDYVRAVASLDM